MSIDGWRKFSKQLKEKRKKKYRWIVLDWMISQHQHLESMKNNKNIKWKQMKEKRVKQNMEIGNSKNHIHISFHIDSQCLYYLCPRHRYTKYMLIYEEWNRKRRRRRKEFAHGICVCCGSYSDRKQKRNKKKENKTAKKSTIHTEWHTEHTIQTHDRRAPTTSCSRLVMFVFWKKMNIVIHCLNLEWWRSVGYSFYFWNCVCNPRNANFHLNQLSRVHLSETIDEFRSLWNLRMNFISDFEHFGFLEIFCSISVITVD